MDDMNDMDSAAFRLSIKADRSGMMVYIPDGISESDICRELFRKFSDNLAAFQKTGTVNISFVGRTLEPGQAERIISFLNNMDRMHVRFVCRSRQTAHTEQTPVRVGNASGYVPVTDVRTAGRRRAPYTTVPEKPYVFRGDIRRKQTLEIRGSVIIIGNVSREASVISGKSVIVIGELAGNALAGRTSPQHSFILATQMNPRSLQIGRARLCLPEIKHPAVPMIATNDNNSIIITCI